MKINGIEDVYQVVKQFIEDRFNIERSRFDSTITAEEYYETLRQFLNQYYTHPEVISYEVNTHSRPDTDSMNQHELNHQIELILKPEIFIIRKYMNPSVGKGIHLDENIIYNVLLGSSHSIGIPTPKYYASNLTFSVIKDELKLMCDRTRETGKYPNRIIRWDVTPDSVCDRNDIKIIEDGTLVETLRIEAPTLEDSLEDYNIG